MFQVVMLPEKSTSGGRVQSFIVQCSIVECVCRQTLAALLDFMSIRPQAKLATQIVKHIAGRCRYEAVI